GVDLHLPPLLLPLLSFARTLGHMVIGFRLAELGLYSAAARVPVTGIFALSFIGSVPLWPWVTAAGIGSTDAHDIAFRTATDTRVMYVAGPTLLVRTRLGAACLSFLRLCGRVAFSNDRGQAVICVLRLPPLASAGHISAPAALGIWAVI